MIKVYNLAKRTEILIYDEIGFFGITAKEFDDEIKAKHKAGTPITVRINSPGGSVMDGIAIFNILSRIDGELEIHIDGICASIATYICMAGDRIVMADNAFFMIHNPQSFTAGESEDLRRTADLMDSMRDTIATAYALKTGKPQDEITSMMNEETWLDSNEALKMGFVDEIGESVKVAANAGGFPKHDARNYVTPGDCVDENIHNLIETIDTTEKELNAMDDIKAELADTKAQILEEQITALTEKLAASEKVAAIASTEVLVEAAMSGAKGLPELCKADIRNTYKGAESAEGIDIAINKQMELVDALTAEIKASTKKEENADVIGLGPDTGAVNVAEDNHSARMMKLVKENGGDYRQAYLDSATSLEG